MKMLKKAASIVLASAMVVSLAACGSSNDKGSSADTDTFKIGGIGPTTGDNAIYGTAVKNGIQLAVDEEELMESRLSISLRMTSPMLKNLSMLTIL